MSYRHIFTSIPIVLLVLACSPGERLSAEIAAPAAPNNATVAAAEIYVASGAGYRKPVDELKSLFESQTHIKVNCIYGNMRQIATQAKNSGKISIVIGDVKFLKKTNIEFKQEIPIGAGRLVLAVDRNLPLSNVAELLDAKYERIILPDGKKAIYGRAAHDVLNHLNIFEQLQPRLVTVQTVPQVTSYLSAGTAQIGFMNQTDFLSLDRSKFKAVEIDPSLYEPIIIEAALTQQSDAAATRYMQFIQSEDARNVFQKFGLGLN